MRAVVGRSGALIHIFTCVPILHQLVTLWTAALIGPFSVGTTVATPTIPSITLINVFTQASAVDILISSVAGTPETTRCVDAVVGTVVETKTTLIDVFTSSSIPQENVS
jgi:hypothetical protein